MTEEELEDLAIQFCTRTCITRSGVYYQRNGRGRTGKITTIARQAGQVDETRQCPLSARRARRLLRLFDRDRSGSINENEFHQFLVQEE